jgi:hypothetical protein
MLKPYGAYPRMTSAVWHDVLHRTPGRKGWCIPSLDGASPHVYAMHARRMVHCFSLSLNIDAT